MTAVLEFVPEDSGDARAPGFGWEVSDAARDDIDEIEANARSAEQRSGSLILRAQR